MSEGVVRAGVRLNERYRLEARLGAGGMGEVWRAVDELLQRTVAVKTMLDSVAGDPDFLRRFAAEATAMARVNHPAVASIHDFGTFRGTTFLVMEFVDGESLADRLKRDGRIAPDETMRLIAQTADGLQAVHDQGLVHRDVKPANLLLRRDGSVVITDFGIAKSADASRITASGAVLGTPSYLSPEQVLGHPADGRSDVYALGLVAYECLAGERPFAGDNPYAVAFQRVQEAPRTIAVPLSGTVRAVVERALTVSPEERWATAAEFAAAARASAGPTGPAGAAVPVAPPMPLTPGTDGRKPGADGRKRTRLALLAGAVALVVAAGIGGWTVRQFGAGDDAGGTGDGAAAGAPGATVSPSAVEALPDGFVACGDVLCPAEPLCFYGMTSISGVAMPPRSITCDGEHVWETFLAVELPGEPPVISSDHPLMETPDIGATCSAEAMAGRSVDPATTKGWRRDAWPIQVGSVWLLHCIATPESGSAEGGAFRT
ncbi:serine/threonine-protein kinase [Actinoplanes sp. NPDC051851]|uniref:serine/threonine-protein kinase n=1 Tax=Actinoplanes sp. NPDC051851 TaxID=3154753 RepID=UPI00342D4F17